jgi:uncharacterized protein involved in outer membrane biogenesis
MPTIPRFLRSPRTWAIALIVLALYAAAGFLLVPRLIAGGVRDYFDHHYHRRVELGRVAFNPFTLELVVEHFAVPDADGGALAGFDRLYVNMRLLSLLRGGMDFQAIALDGPRARLVRRADGRINVMDLVPPPGPPAPTNARPPRVWIDELSVRGGETSFVDQSGNTSLNVTLKPISFTLHDFNTRSEGNAYRFSARSSRDETLEWQGSFGFDPIIQSQGSFRIGHLLAATIDEVGPSLLPVELAAGSFDITGNYELAERDHALGLKVRVAELAGTDLALRATGTSDSWVQVPRLAVTGTTVDLLQSAVDVEQILLERPVVKAWRERDGTLNLLRLFRGALAASAAADTGGAAAPAAKPWTVRVSQYKIAGGDLTFEDRVPTRAASFHVAPLDASVGGFAVPAAAPLDIAVNAKVNGDGTLTAKGTLALSPFAGKFEVEGAALGLVALQPYLGSTTAMTLKSGTASAKGTVSASADGKIEFRGDASIDGLRTVDNALQEDFVKWRSVKLSGIRATSAPVAVKVREIAAREPYARVIIGSTGVTNLSAVLNPHGAPPADETATPAPAAPAGASRERGAAGGAATPPAAALPVEIGSVRIVDGSMNFADYSVKPNVATGIYELAGTINGLSGRADARSEIKLDGKVDRYAPVAITGTVNFLAAVGYTNVQMSIKNVDLAVLSPYSGKFAGYRIDKGKLSLELKYLIENRKLSAEHRIIVNQLQLGEQVDSSEATHLPVKLAIALLKDRDGVIDLNLPVSGSLDDPKFRLGPIIWKVVVNLIEKAVTAPFKLLGALFGGGEEMSYVDFAAGSATLDEASRGKLASLVKALESRPGLNLEVPLVVAPAADTSALAEQLWRADVTARAVRRLGARSSESGAVDRLLASPKDYRALLEDAYREVFGRRAEIPPPEAAQGAPPPDPAAAAIGWLEGQLKSRLTVGQEQLDDLAQGRAGAVQSALLDGTGIDPTRLFVVKSSPLPAAAGPVRMQLTLR